MYRCMWQAKLQRSYKHHVALVLQELQPSHARSHRSDLKSSLPPPGHTFSMRMTTKEIQVTTKRKSKNQAISWVESANVCQWRNEYYAVEFCGLSHFEAPRNSNLCGSSTIFTAGGGVCKSPSARKQVFWSWQEFSTPAKSKPIPKTMGIVDCPFAKCSSNCGWDTAIDRTHLSCPLGESYLAPLKLSISTAGKFISDS